MPSSAKTVPANRRSSKSSPERTSPIPAGSNSPAKLSPASIRRGQEAGDRRHLPTARPLSRPRWQKISPWESRLRGFWRRIAWRDRRRRAERILARVGANIDPDALVRTFPCRSSNSLRSPARSAANARVLILDEPTASLSDREVDHLLDVLRELKKQGVGIIYISHRLEELRRIADRVSVLRDGRSVGTRRNVPSRPGQLIRLMVGRDVTAILSQAAVPIGNVILSIRKLACRAGGNHDINLDVRAGEIVGLAGLVGAGRTELARVLFGLTPADRGEILWRGRPTKITSPARAVDLGIAYIPEDRRRHGVILEMPVATNTSLARPQKMSAAGLFDFTRERKLAGDFVNRLGVKTASLDTPVGNLSGGNQQKVAMARWLATKPILLILDEPDAGNRRRSQSRNPSSDERPRGPRESAILMISSELPEILGMSDRIAVMHAGRIVGEFDRAAATQERILELAVGHGDGN